MSPEDLGTQVKLGGPGGESPWPPHTNMAKTTECPQRTLESFILGRGRAKGKQETDPVCAPEHRRQRGQAHPDFP